MVAHIGSFPNWRLRKRSWYRVYSSYSQICWTKERTFRL